MDWHDMIAIGSFAFGNVAVLIGGWMKIRVELATLKSANQTITTQVMAIKTNLDHLRALSERIVSLETKLGNGMTTQLNHVIEEQDRMREELAGIKARCDAFMETRGHQKWSRRGDE